MTTKLQDPAVPFTSSLAAFKHVAYTKSPVYLNGIVEGQTEPLYVISEQAYKYLISSLEDKEERIVDVKVSFNGIEYDGQLLEDLLQKQWKLRCEKLDKKYSDLEALAIIKAQELFNKFTSDLSHPIFHKLDTIRECVEAVHLELDCYNPQLKDWSTDNE